MQANPTISTPTLPQRYVEARQKLHAAVKANETAAKREGDRITLTQSVQHEGTTFKAGSAYYLHPYSPRSTHLESIKYGAGGQDVVINHIWQPGTFKTHEVLTVNTTSRTPMSAVHDGQEMDRTSYGWRPAGWLNRSLRNVEGVNLEP